MRRIVSPCRTTFLPASVQIGPDQSALAPSALTRGGAPPAGGRVPPPHTRVRLDRARWGRDPTAPVAVRPALVPVRGRAPGGPAPPPATRPGSATSPCRPGPGRRGPP